STAGLTRIHTCREWVSLSRERADVRSISPSSTRRFLSVLCPASEGAAKASHSEPLRAIVHVNAARYTDVEEGFRKMRRRGCSDVVYLSGIVNTIFCVVPIRLWHFGFAQVKSQRDTGPWAVTIMIGGQDLAMDKYNGQKRESKAVGGTESRKFPRTIEALRKDRSREKSKRNMCAGTEVESTLCWPDTAKSNIFNNFEGSGKIAENRTRGQKSGTNSRTGRERGRQESRKQQNEFGAWRTG
ncbi:hypothetical protein B0H13DRAFT_1928458, partial [Mycena leptocephala]